MSIHFLSPESANKPTYNNDYDNINIATIFLRKSTHNIIAKKFDLESYIIMSLQSESEADIIDTRYIAVSV